MHDVREVIWIGDDISSLGVRQLRNTILLASPGPQCPVTLTKNHQTDVILVKVAHYSRRKWIVEPHHNQKLWKAYKKIYLRRHFQRYFAFLTCLHYFFLVWRFGAPPRPRKKRRAFGLSYLIDENPPGHICLMLGFQVRAALTSRLFLFLDHLSLNILLGLAK